MYSSGNKLLRLNLDWSLMWNFFHFCIHWDLHFLSQTIYFSQTPIRNYTLWFKSKTNSREPKGAFWLDLRWKILLFTASHIKLTFYENQVNISTFFFLNPIQMHPKCDLCMPCFTVYYIDWLTSISHVQKQRIFGVLPCFAIYI